MNADIAVSITLGAAALAGIAASGHCLSMCGGLMGALRLRQTDSASSLRSTLLQQAGRIAGYALAGLIFGWLGSSLPTASLPMLAQVMRAAGGGLIILMAVRILFGWNPLRSIERLGAILWIRIRPAMRYANGHRNSTVSALLTGLLWGWMPCGLVYSMLVLAAVSGHAAMGASVMIAFGIGTLPAVLASSYLFAKLPRRLARWSPRYANGVLLLAFGVWLSLSALSGSHQAHVHHVPAEVAHQHELHTHASDGL